MAMTDLTNQRQVFVEEYVRSGDHYFSRIDNYTQALLGEEWMEFSPLSLH